MKILCVPSFFLMATRIIDENKYAKLFLNPSIYGEVEVRINTIIANLVVWPLSLTTTVMVSIRFFRTTLSLIKGNICYVDS